VQNSTILFKIKSLIFQQTE